MHATPAGPTENVPQKTPILLLYHILARPKKSALGGRYFSSSHHHWQRFSIIL
jgi:hypothetical protein